MRIPLLIFTILILPFSMNCTNLQSLAGMNSKQSESAAETAEKKPVESQENFAVSSRLLEEKNYLVNELTFEIKKLRAELNSATSDIKHLNDKIDELANPFKQFNKEILLNNESIVYGKILFQDDTSIKVATIMGTLTLQRNNIIRVVERETMQPPSIEEVTAIEGENTFMGSTGSGFINNLGVQDGQSKPIMNSANLVLIGNIDEHRDKSGNTILSGEVKNIGTKRADFAKVNFTIKKNWNGDTKTMTAFLQGTYHTFESGVTANSSVLPGATSSFELIIPTSIGPYIGYSYDIEWDEYQ